MRGQRADVGATRVAPNGYHYTKVEGGWRLTHHIYAERYLGRPLREDERVAFATGNKLDFSEDNIRVLPKGKASIRRRRAVVEARIEELQAELRSLDAQLQNEQLAQTSNG